MAAMAVACSPEDIMASLADGDADEREAAYVALEAAVRGALSPAVVALAVACVEPLISSVLCAPASRVGADEWMRASLLLYEVGKCDVFAVGAALYRKNDEGLHLLFSAFAAPDTALAAMLAKDEWTRDDAVLAALSTAPHSPTVARCHAVCMEGGIDEMEWMSSWATTVPYHSDSVPADRYEPLALLCMDLIRSEIDSQPEGVIVGAGQTLCWMAIGKTPVAKGLHEAGFLEVFAATMQRYNPMERLLLTDLIPSATSYVLKDVVEGVQATGVDIIQPLFDAGAVDIAISALQAYRMLGRPEAASAAMIQWGVMYTLEIMLESPQAELVVDKLRKAGVDCFLYLLDNPCVLLRALGWETGVHAVKIAAQTWGRDEAGGAGLRFKQANIDMIVQAADSRGPLAAIWTMKAAHGQPFLNLCVSDANKELLLACEGFIPLIVDHLLLDPSHPRMDDAPIHGKTKWEHVKAPVQRVRRNSSVHVSHGCLLHLKVSCCLHRTSPRPSHSLLCTPLVLRRCSSTSQALLRPWSKW
eukprot:COSAG02_NODE_5156_length_4583_cov_2.229706_2_plen_530_part_00